jgi:hypothetical protein
MPKLSDIRRIIPEDVDDKSTPTEIVESIAGSYNEFSDEIFQVVNGQLDFDNLARSKVDLEITFTSEGKPNGNALINSKLTNVTMLHIGKIQDLSSTSSKLTQFPYIDWSHQGNGVVKVNYGVGFLPGVKYRLTLELIQ